MATSNRWILTQDVETTKGFVLRKGTAFSQTGHRRGLIAITVIKVDGVEHEILGSLVDKAERLAAAKPAAESAGEPDTARPTNEQERTSDDVDPDS